MTLKPQLANDADIEKVIYPVGFQPKIDGVRAMNLTGQLTGRSLDPLKGFGITEYFSKPEFIGLDGELIAGSIPNCPDRLCSRTTSATGKFKGVTEMADVSWWTFDLLTSATIQLPYRKRYDALYEKAFKLDHPKINVVPLKIIHNRDELDEALADVFANNYEGGILRNLDALPKEGRPNKLQQLMRFKPWSDAEILVTGITEGNSNENEATVNSLGRTERSSSKDGMVPNGMVGSIQGTLLADFYDPFSKKLLFKKGLPVTISKGEMTAEEAKFFFENQHKIIGKVAKWVHMTHGVKDLPRFPIFKSLRSAEDMD